MRMLITGLSGTGKSSVTAALRNVGIAAIDLDESPYSELRPAPPGERTGIGGGMDWVWNEERVRALIDDAGESNLALSGCSPNQGSFYAAFDEIVLLTAPTTVIEERLGARTTNDFGKNSGELANALALIEEIEPLLRKRATVVIDTSIPFEEVVTRLVSMFDENDEQSASETE